MKNILRKMRWSKRKGQTALEYALVIGAISLVVMVAWNQIGGVVQDEMMNTIMPMIQDNLGQGNATATN